MSATGTMNYGKVYLAMYSRLTLIDLKIAIYTYRQFLQGNNGIWHQFGFLYAVPSLKAEPIMLLVLPIILSRINISPPLFIPMPSPINTVLFLYYSLNFITSVTVMSTLHIYDS